MPNGDPYDVYCQWWRERYGYDCPISRHSFERYLATDHPRAVYDESFDLDTERREGWSNGY